jgi:hypothetical protein
MIFCFADVFFIAFGFFTKNQPEGGSLLAKNRV